MIAVHLGVADEDMIDDMSFLFFESVLEELGHKLHYDAVVNYAGNSFAEKSWEMIAEFNPFNVKEKQGSSAANGVANFFGKADIKIVGG